MKELYPDAVSDDMLELPPEVEDDWAPKWYQRASGVKWVSFTTAASFPIIYILSQFLRPFVHSGIIPSIYNANFFGVFLF